MKWIGNSYGRFTAKTVLTRIALLSILLVVGGVPTSLRGSCPTVTISIKFTGSKTTGDALSFGAASYDCSESLGPQACSQAWLWNIKGQGIVSDDASKWAVHQSVTSGRADGYYKDSNGVLQWYDYTINQPDDDPESKFLQQPAGQTTIYWLDAPGHYTTYDGYPIDSMTEVENFTTTFCSTTVTNDCTAIQWYIKIMVTTGANLDTRDSTAGYGSASTNF